MQENVNDMTATIEAVLFTYGAPLTFARLANILDVAIDDIRADVDALRILYEERDAGLCVIIKDDAVQLVSHSSQAEIITTFLKKEREGDLSQAGLEVLAVISYRGPLAKPDIEAIRGVNCAFTLRNLLLRGLIERVAHPTDGRTKLYRTTMNFLHTLGIKDAQELPHFKELAEDRRIDAVLTTESTIQKKETTDGNADVTLETLA